MPAGAFVDVIAAEALLGRPNELVIIVNNGMGKFGRAATLAIIGSAVRRRRGGRLHRDAGRRARGLELDLPRRQCGVALHRRPVLLSAPAALLKAGLYFKRLPDAL